MNLWALDVTAGGAGKTPVVRQFKGHTKSVVNDADWSAADAHAFASVGTVRLRRRVDERAGGRRPL